VKRRALVLIVFFTASLPIYSQARKQTGREDTWYEQALRHFNPNHIDYGAIWEQRKRAILQQVGSPYFQYSLVTTTAVLLLLTVVCVQRMSYKRSLDIAALSIADVLRHDEYSRKVADEAIRRYNEHIENCNRWIEAGQDSEVELQRLRRELADTQLENKSLRNQVATTEKILAGITAQGKAEQVPPVHQEPASEPGHLAARIASLEKQLRAEQRKNQRQKGTSVDDHRA
jgi:hypothetical protein